MRPNTAEVPSSPLISLVDSCCRSWSFDSIYLKPFAVNIAKDHEDIDLLKCRSFCVSRTFPDAQVLSPEFKNTLAGMVAVVMPLVHCLKVLKVTAVLELGV